MDCPPWECQVTVLAAPDASMLLRRVLISLALVAILRGVLRQIVEPGERYADIDIPFSFASLWIGFAWFRADANRRGRRRSALQNVAILVLPIVAFPVYLFSTRGSRRGLKATGIFLLIAAGYSMLEWGGSYGVYFAKAN